MVFLICYPTASFPEGGEPELPLRVVDHLLIGWTPSTTNPVFSKRTPLCGSPSRRGRPCRAASDDRAEEEGTEAWAVEQHGL